MNKKTFLKRAGKIVKGMGKDLHKSPLGRAARGKHTKGFY